MRKWKFISPFGALCLSFLLAAVVLAGTITSITWTPIALNSGESTIHLTAGPDGNAWATEQMVGQILKIASDGSITRFACPANITPIDITAGPDGNLWFDAAQASGSSNVSVIGKITTAGVITIFPYPDASAFTMFGAGPIAGSSDGFVYVVDQVGNKVGKIAPATGAVTEIPLSGQGYAIAALPDGSVAIPELTKLARIANGNVTETSFTLAAARDGVSACTFNGNPSICLAASSGFGSTGNYYLDVCTYAGACTSYPVQTNGCQVEQIDCSTGDCYLTTPPNGCQQVVHADMTQNPPTSNIIAGPAGYSSKYLKFLIYGAASGVAGRSPLGMRAVAFPSWLGGVFVRQGASFAKNGIIYTNGYPFIGLPSLTGCAANPITVNTPGPNQAFTRGTEGNLVMGRVAGGTPPYHVSFSGGSPPPGSEIGFFFDMESLIISLPSVPGHYSFTYFVTDSGNPPCSVTASFTLVVLDPRSSTRNLEDAIRDTFGRD